MPRTVIFLEDLGLGEKRIAEMLAPISIRRLTLSFLIVNTTRGSPAFYGGHRGLCGRPWDPSLGVPWEPGTVCLPMFSLTNG
jgi:hypothetical protein